MCFLSFFRKLRKIRAILLILSDKKIYKTLKKPLDRIYKINKILLPFLKKDRKPSHSLKDRLLCFLGFFRKLFRMELAGPLGLNARNLDRIYRIYRIIIFAFPEEKRKTKAFTAYRLCFLSFFRKL